MENFSKKIVAAAKLAPASSMMDGNGMRGLLDKYLAFVKNFIPDKQAQTTIGLDIGRTTCKMVEVRAKGASYELVNWAIEPIANGDKKGAIKKVLAKASAPTVSPVTSLAGKGTLIRYIEMPQMALEDLRKSFSLEADKYFPFPTDQIYTDCFILSPKTKDNKMAVLVAASKKELVDERIKVLTESGLQSEFIGLDSTAIANLYYVLGNSIVAEDPIQGAVAILDIGSSVTNLNIVLNRLPQFTRDLFVGGQDFSKSISSALGVSLEAAEQLKFQPGDKLPEILQAIDSVVMSLVSELRLSFDYFVNEQDVPIGALLLTGGGALLPGLSDLLAKHVEVPVKTLNTPAALSLTAELNQEKFKKDAARLSVALGLALYN